MREIDRYGKLLDEVDRRFAAIGRRQVAKVTCHSGCTDCCRARLSVTHVEAAHLRRGLARLPGALRRRLAGRAADAGREYCPGLGDDGGCEIYALRPLICRSIGVPLRHESREPLIQPPVIDVCDKNSTDSPLQPLPAGDTLNQTALTRRLRVIDAHYCAVRKLPAYERVPLAQVLRQSASKPAAL